MNKYFAMRMASTPTAQISQQQISQYRELVKAEMKKMGATEHELTMIHEATIRNSIINKREPGDVAWAILQ